MIGKFPAKNKNGNVFLIDKNDPDFINGELVGIAKGHVCVFDKNLNQSVKITLEEYYSNKDRYLTSTKDKVIVKDSNNNLILISKNDPSYIDGSIKRQNFGFCIPNKITKQKQIEARLAFGIKSRLKQYPEFLEILSDGIYYTIENYCNHGNL